MSSQTRASGGGGGGGGGRNAKKSNSSTGDTVVSKKTEHVKTEKEKPHAKPTAEQMRIAQITDINSGSDDPKMREKVANLMETTQRTEEEVCCALYECDNDMDRAATFLFESLPVGAFDTISKKKKTKAASGGTDAGGDGDDNANGGANNTNSNNNNNNSDIRERSRNRSGMRGGRGGSDSRGWRGRESRENDRNAVNRRGGGGGGIGGIGGGGGGSGTTGDITGNGGSGGGGGGGGNDNRWQGGGRGVGSRGGFRGGYGGRGGRGGRMGTRSRDQNRSNYFRSEEPHETVDTWDNTIASSVIEQNKSDDTWGDWDNEEYTGSLADTKVFTPSAVQNATAPSDLSAPPGLEQQILNPPNQLNDDLVYQTTVVSSTATAGAVAAVNNNQVQYPEMHAPSAAQHGLGGRPTLDMPQISSGSLSVEQSQYFNSLTSQNSNQPSIGAYQVPQTVQYPTAYGTTNTYADQMVSSQPPVQRKQPRARVPPPSKIPSSAVEMPGDTLNNIGYLDVQFGGLDFGTEESFDSISEKFNSSVIENSQNVAAAEMATDYQTKSTVPQPNQTLSTGLQASQILSNADANDNLSSSYSQRTANVQQQSGSVGSTISNNTALDQLTKTDHYSSQSVNPTAGAGYQHQSAYTNNVNATKTTPYQSAAAPQGYTNSSYSNSQVTTGSSYPTSSITYSSYNQTPVNSYQPQTNSVVNSANNSNTGSGGGGVGVGVSASSGSVQNIPVGGSNSSVNNSNSNTSSGYLSSQYPSQTSVSYPSQQSGGYQNNQSVYGNTGLSNNTGYASSTNTTTGQYSNFSTTKLSKDSTPVTTIYESNVSSSAPSAVANAAVASTTASSMSSPSLGLTNTKATNSTANKNAASGVGGVSGGNNNNNNNNNSSSSSSGGVGGSGGSGSGSGGGGGGGGGGVVPNLPMVSQYIQTGMPYYQQPIYSFEDIQIMQQRMPHVPAGYYDINYQTPTSLGAAGVRDANIGSVAYSTMSDARFTRTDNNSSPVSNVPSSTMSQQTGSGGPMLNLPYAYFYGGNMMPGGFQYGTPAIYPQQMATANASSGAQFPKPSYNSGYNSTGYDTLSQSTQEYKAAYPGTGVGQQSKGQSVSNPQPATGSDISSSMYGKSHVALNKVNSYENKSFHSGTPPPFNLPGTQTAGATSAQAYGAQHLYIPAMPAAHHNINMHQPIHQDYFF